MCNSKKGISIINKIPRNRILPESDGPFTVMRNKTIYPWEAINVVNTLMEIWQCNHDDVISQLKINLDTLLGRI